MLCTLTAGYAIPLVLQSDVFIFLHRANGGNGGSHWNSDELEVVLRALAMFAVLLLRLIWIVSSAEKSGEETQAAWSSEAKLKVLVICVALYRLGWVIAWNLARSQAVRDFMITRQDLKKSVGLILDWFLLPQVVANVVWNVGTLQPVSNVFYWGLTFVRSFLHVHDIWRNREIVFPLAGFEEKFAGPSWNFLFFSWDIIALGISVIVAMVLFVQQRWGVDGSAADHLPQTQSWRLSENCKPLSMAP